MVGLLLGELVGGEFVDWPEPDSFSRNRNPAGIRKNPEKSGGIRWKYRNSCPAGTPAKKNPVKWLKTGFFKTPPKPRSCEQIPSGKNGKKGILRNPVLFCFSVQKVNSCQAGITNLGPRS
jgi:hypothetical protein